jgi:hypothetical protein
MWFDVVNCNRENYHVIANYDIAKTTIDGQLQQMYNNGQRTLRILLHHSHGGERCTGPLGTRGTGLDSTGAFLSPQCQANLQNFLQSAYQIGFRGATFSFGPLGSNNPQNWPETWYQQQSYNDLSQENWNFIGNLHSLIAGSGMNFKIDLMNEGIPPSNSVYNGWRTYASWLYGNYSGVFGTADTVGFSFGPDTAGLLDSVYHGNNPPVFEIHFYPAAGTAASVYQSTWNTLASQGKTEGWIIGEGFYNDVDEASGLAAGHAAAGNTVFMLTQWPASRPSACGGANIDVVPLNYNNYIANGW